MANEITNAALVSAGGRVSAVLSALVLEQLYDPTDLRAIMQFVPWDQSGAATMDVTLDAVPGAFAAASSETSGGFSNAAYTTSKFQLTVARYGRQYQATDLMGISGGPIDLDNIVRNLINGVALTMTDLATALFPSFTDQVGSTGVDLDTDKIYDAQFALAINNASASGGLNCVLHPQQHNDFITSLRAETGAQQYVPATAEMLSLKGPGIQGTWNGITFWTSDSVTTVNAGADYAGALLSGKEAIAYTLGDVKRLQGHVPAQNVLVDAGMLLVELNRDADNGMSTAIANLYPAVAIREDARGVEIVSDWNQAQVKEIAEILGKSEPTTRVLLHRALQSLKSEVKEV